MHWYCAGTVGHESYAKACIFQLDGEEEMEEDEDGEIDMFRVGFMAV